MPGQPQVRVVGAERLAATLHLAAVRIQDQSKPGQRAAALVASRGRSGAPSRSGRLRASVASNTDRTTAEVTSGLAYSARTHWGYRAYQQAPQPFLADPAHAMEPTWVGYYQAEAERLLQQVKGA